MQHVAVPAHQDGEPSAKQPQALPCLHSRQSQQVHHRTHINYRRQVQQRTKHNNSHRQQQPTYRPSLLQQKQKQHKHKHQFHLITHQQINNLILLNNQQNICLQLIRNNLMQTIPRNNLDIQPHMNNMWSFTQRRHTTTNPMIHQQMNTCYTNQGHNLFYQ